MGNVLKFRTITFVGDKILPRHSYPFQIIYKGTPQVLITMTETVYRTDVDNLPDQFEGLMTVAGKEGKYKVTGFKKFGAGYELEASPECWTALLGRKESTVA